MNKLIWWFNRYKSLKDLFHSLVFLVLGYLQLTFYHSHKLLVACPSEIAVADTVDRCEVHNCIADDTRSLQSCRMWAHQVSLAHKHWYWRLFDTGEVNGGHLSCALLPVRRILLESIREVSVLPPVKLTYDWYCLPITSELAAGLLTQFIADPFVVSHPSLIMTVEAMNS